MTPAMLATWAFGMSLAVIPGVLDWSEIWPWVKLTLYFGHDSGFIFGWPSGKAGFELGDNQLSGKTYRIMNEVPTSLVAGDRCYGCGASF